MPEIDWAALPSKDFPVPGDAPLDDLTESLTVMLGSPDPRVRDEQAYPVLATWIERGVYDDLLTGLGDGMAAGLEVGLGHTESPMIFRRSFSALVLAECIRRDNTAHLLPDTTIMSWGDRLVGWWLAEKDLRGWVPGHGWAHAMAHGADALGVLAKSRHLTALELVVLLDVVADRLLDPTNPVFEAGEPDRLAAAVLAVLQRGLVSVDVVSPWLARIAVAAAPGDADNPYPACANPQAFLRALHLMVQFAPEPPPERADLALAIADVLRETNPWYLAPAVVHAQ